MMEGYFYMGSNKEFTNVSSKNDLFILNSFLILNPIAPS